MWFQLVSSDVVAPFGVDSIRVEGGFMFVGMSKGDEGIVKVYNLNAGGAAHQLTGHKVRKALRVVAQHWLPTFMLHFTPSSTDVSHQLADCRNDGQTALGGQPWCTRRLGVTA